MAAFGPAFLLPWLTPAQALGIAALLAGMNAFVLPRLAPGLYRPGEPGRGALEIILYPVAVMASVAAYGIPAPDSSPSPSLSLGTAAPGGGGQPAWYLVPALAWFALAFGDAASGIGNRLLRRGPALPWNPRKTLAGTAFGLLASGLCLAALAAALVRWGRPPPAGPEALALPIALAALLALAALAETLWFGIADNLVVPFAVCAAAPLLPWPAPAGGIPEVTWLAALPAAFGALAYALRLLTAGGAALGSLLSVPLLCAEPRLFLFLGGFFVLGVAATRWRYGAKAERRIAEGRGGRRDAAQVFGAMGAAVWMTPLVHLARPAGPEAVHGALLVCAAPFLAKAMDTVSSELGKAVGGATVSLRGFRRVAPGAEGGVSLAGTAGGLLAAALLAAAVPLLGWGGWGEAAALVGIAFAANLFESYWGEWALRRGIDDSPHANFLMTLGAALLAWLLWIGLPPS